MKRWLWMIGVLLFVAACSSDGVPRATPTVDATNTPTPTTDATAIADLPSRTPVISTPTTEPSATVTASATRTDAPTITNTTTPAPTDTPDPSETSTNTHTATATSTPDPSATDTPEPTNTPRPTRTPTRTLTNTPDPSRTPTRTATVTPSSTATLTATATASPTQTPPPSVTPLPLIQPTSTRTPSPTPTATVTPSLTPTVTLTDRPTATPTHSITPLPPTADLTQIANAIFATQTAFADRQTPTPSATTPPPTLDVTPTFITAEPQATVPPTAEDLGIFTPPPGESDEGPTATPRPNPTVELAVPIPATVSVEDLLPPVPPSINNTAPLAFTIGPGGVIQQGNVNVGLDRTNLFAQNPVDPSQYVATSGTGEFYFVDDNVPVRPGGPNTPFPAFGVGRPEENQYFVDHLKWAPDGEWVALVIDGYDGYDRELRVADPTAADGVHLYNPSTGEFRKLLTDAPRDWHPGLLAGGEGRPFLAATSYIEWAPNGDRLLARVQRMNDRDEREQDLGAIAVLSLDQNGYAQPNYIYFDHATWALDSRTMVLSGSGPIPNSNTRTVIATVPYDNLSAVNIVLDASALGLWVEHAVQRPNESFVALGRQGNKFGPMRIVDQNGTFLTGDIGTTRPARVSWNGDGSGVLVTTEDGRQFLATITGTVQEVSGGSNAVNWVNDGLPANNQPDALPEGQVPSGVVEGSRYAAGQQVQIASQTLNLRTDPGIAAPLIRPLEQSEYVVILAGPAQLDGYPWWYVQTADRTTGWIAGEINGFATIN